MIGAFDRGLHFDDADTAYSSALIQIAHWGFSHAKESNAQLIAGIMVSES